MRCGREGHGMTTRRLVSGVSVGFVGIALALSVAVSPIGSGAQQAASEAIRIDDDDIGGVVTGPNGPGAGVWVIAETADLPTRFGKIVGTDDQRRSVVADLRRAT